MTITMERPARAAEDDTAQPEGPTGKQVLNEARAFIARFWVPPSQAALDAMTLWAAHTHCTDQDGTLAFWSTPRLAFVSDDPGSGKTAALELLELLCPRAERVTDPTAPALLELIATRHATLMIDEIDLLFGAGQAAKSVRAVINSGYRRGASVARVRGPQETLAPVALAGLAASFMGNPTLAPTRSRAIIVHCAKPPPGVRPERYRGQLHEGVGRLAGASLAAWASAHLMDITLLWPDMPAGLSGRQEDIWQPLVAIAEVAGGDWPQRCRAAIAELARGEQSDTPHLPPRLRLIDDIRAVWPDQAGRMPTADLVAALSGLRGAPWASMWTPVAMTREIPAMLGIQPVKIKTGGRAVQGYQRHQMEPLWAQVPAA